MSYFYTYPGLTRINIYHQISNHKQHSRKIIPLTVEHCSTMLIKNNGGEFNGSDTLLIANKLS